MVLVSVDEIFLNQFLWWWPQNTDLRKILSFFYISWFSLEEFLPLSSYPFGFSIYTHRFFVIESIIIHYWHSFDVQIIMDLTMGTSPSLFLCPFDMSPSVCEHVLPLKNSKLSRLTLYFLETSHFSKEPWFLLLEN